MPPARERACTPHTLPVAATVTTAGIHAYHVDLSDWGAELPPGPGDAPVLLFHGTYDTLVPYKWATATVRMATEKGLEAFLTTYAGEGHVPYRHRDEIIARTRNFLYWQLRLLEAPT